MIAVLSFIIIALLVVIDRLIKIIMQLWLRPSGTADFIPGVVRFSYTENKGAAFGMLQNYRWVFITVTLAIILIGAWLLIKRRIKGALPVTAAVMIMAGGLGNLIDRLFTGYVVDYIEPVFINFAIFNFADSLVCVGAVLYIAHVIWASRGHRGRRGKRSR